MRDKTILLHGVLVRQLELIVHQSDIGVGRLDVIFEFTFSNVV